MEHTYRTKGVCATRIDFDLNDDVVSNIKFHGGCNGNLKAIATLVDGMTVKEISEKLAGNKCGMKSTSCADQLVQALLKAQDTIAQP